MKPSFIHLRVHTEYSLSDGLLRIEELIAATAQMKMPAIAITDQSNLFAAIKFYQAAMAAGIKPIIGADCWLENLQKHQQPSQMTLLCQNEAGYKNLIYLISRSYLEGQASGRPLLKKNWLAHHNAGLIALSGGRQGEIGQALLSDQQALAETLSKEWLASFPKRFYLELQRTGRPQEERYITQAVKLAQKLNIPVLATQEVCFMKPEDFEAHEARVCINSARTLSDAKRPRLYSEQQYLCSPEEMQRRFADMPAALANTVELAKRCNLELRLNQPFLPDFPIPSDTTAENFLIREAHAGLVKQLAKKAELDQARYTNRLEEELHVINSMGFAGYFLIVADFIRWARENHIPVGPGRGSGAGSLVAYALQITAIDPLQYNLLFERFLNPERVSMPDFDIDFCMEKRDSVIEYVAERYGRDAVSQIITYGRMSAKAVVRDVGRVLGYPYGMVDKLAKLIPFKLGITLREALTEEELKRRYEDEEETKTLINLALKLEGLARNVGKHAGGVVIAPSKLTDFTPLYCEANDNHRCITQYDKNDIETVGLVKFDFLGLRTLTIIDWAVQMINEKRQANHKPLLDLTQIPLNDAKTFDLLKACKTTAVFQFESRGMKDLIQRMQPDKFEELIALGALFRPGPLQSGMVDDFINRKHGRSKIDYLHPTLESILSPTYGIIVYQEQVLQIAQTLAGYSLGAADLLRRAMGKKKAESMAKQRTIFVMGAKKRGITEEVASFIFGLMEKFADYGFNKSHAAAYALVSYQTAWLKTHYPAEFMAAVLSADMDNTEKVVLFLAECRAMKLTIFPPNINQSHYKFTVNEKDEIIYGLGAIKGIGATVIDLILKNRGREGPFKDLFDFCRRVDTRKLNKRALDALIHSGSFDIFGMDRASLINELEDTLRAAEQQLQAIDTGQQDLLGLAKIERRTPTLATLPAEVLLQKEKAILGFYLSGHPLNNYETELQNFVTVALDQVNRYQAKSVIIAGWVVSVRNLLTKRGELMAVIILEDHHGNQLELTVFNEVYIKCRQLLVKEQVLVVEGEVTLDDYTSNARLLAKRILNIEAAREKYVRCLLLKISAEKLESSLIHALRQIMANHPGCCPVSVEYQDLSKNVRAQLWLSLAWKIKPSDDLLQITKNLLGEGAVQLQYA